MDDFEQHRQFLVGVAYRMLGSLAEAEDIVQDAYLRWADVDHAEVHSARAYLAQIVSRLCLDRMKSAAARRETYVGTWLPEPLVAAEDAPSSHDLSLALLLALERLTPLERAAFLLHDVFDLDYAVIAESIGRSEEACRQLAARGREHVRSRRPRFRSSPESTAKIVDAFAAALKQGKLDELARYLADEAVVYMDGGGKRGAALNPIFGREKITRFLVGVTKKAAFGPHARVERFVINELPGFVIWTSDGPETMSIEIADDQIVGIYVIRNPDKLRHLVQ